ncbi:MAG: hypothetical protein J6R30_08250 [Bacteroidales bacterium]|nr:hypothetical protein [Bacteroidales bacterium]
MNKIRDFIEERLLIYLMFIFVIVVCGLFIGGYIMALVKYGNTPITEVPLWAYWYLGG